MLYVTVENIKSIENRGKEKVEVVIIHEGEVITLPNFQKVAVMNRLSWLTPVKNRRRGGGVVVEEEEEP